MFSGYVYYVVRPAQYQLATSYLKAAALSASVLAGILGDLLVVEGGASLDALMWISCVSVCAGFAVGLFVLRPAAAAVVRRRKEEEGGSYSSSSSSSLHGDAVTIRTKRKQEEKGGDVGGGKQDEVGDPSGPSQQPAVVRFASNACIHGDAFIHGCILWLCLLTYFLTITSIQIIHPKTAWGGIGGGVVVVVVVMMRPQRMMEGHPPSR